MPLYSTILITDLFGIIDTSAVPVMFTIIEPASVLMCACLPMVPALWKHIPQPKLASYFSRFLGRSRGTAETSGTSRDPLPTKKLPKAAGWTQLNETSSSNQAKRDRQAKRLGSQSNEDYELSPTYAGNIV